ncbi:MAG: hypothetical protein ACK40K_04090 [Raineya sp.]
MTRADLIEKHKFLFWYMDKSKIHTISDAVVVEFILNYGDIQAVKDLLEVLGKEQVARIFAESIKKPRNNYFPQVKNFFHLYFQKNVPEYPF